MSADHYEEGEEEERRPGNAVKKSNVLPLWGNDRTMNLNPLILTNIQSSHYFKVNLYELKTYHEVIDEIYYKVAHLEPWEKGSRKTSGQTGMCGGVRGVGAGGIVSTAYCLLYKLFTLKLTRKQLNGLITHPDSPYIRALGFMYIRYTQPPPDLWDWYDEYLEDSEELDVKAGGGQVMTMGNVLKCFLSKLEWFSTLFPRIPVPIQQKIERNLSMRFANQKQPAAPKPRPPEPEPEKRQRSRSRERRDVDREIKREADWDRRDADRHSRPRSKDRYRPPPPESRTHREERGRERERERDRERRPVARSRERSRRDSSREKARVRDSSRDRARPRSRSRTRHHRH